MIQGVHAVSMWTTLLSPNSLSLLELHVREMKINATTYVKLETPASFPALPAICIFYFFFFSFDHLGMGITLRDCDANVTHSRAVILRMAFVRMAGHSSAGLGD